LKKHWKAILVLVLVFGGLGWFFVGLQQERASMTAAAPAIVTGAEFKPDPESSSLDQTQIDYVVDAAGTPVQASSTLPGDRTGDYPIGQNIAVCYKPDEPTVSRVNTDGSACEG
jgi:hypothetical protein